MRGLVLAAAAARQLDGTEAREPARAPPAPPPAPEPGANGTAACIDADRGAADADGKHCFEYRPESCGLQDDADFTAAAMCCACGGGERACATGACLKAGVPDDACCGHAAEVGCGGGLYPDLAGLCWRGLQGGELWQSCCREPAVCALPQVLHARTCSGADLRWGDRCTPTCYRGYVPRGDATLSCRGSEPVGRFTCEVMEAAVHGSVAFPGLAPDACGVVGPAAVRTLRRVLGLGQSEVALSCCGDRCPEQSFGGRALRGPEAGAAGRRLALWLANDATTVVDFELAGAACPLLAQLAPASATFWRDLLQEVAPADLAALMSPVDLTGDDAVPAIVNADVAPGQGTCASGEDQDAYLLTGETLTTIVVVTGTVVFFLVVLAIVVLGRLGIGKDPEEEHPPPSASAAPRYTVTQHLQKRTAELKNAEQRAQSPTEREGLLAMMAAASTPGAEAAGGPGPPGAGGNVVGRAEPPPPPEALPDEPQVPGLDLDLRRLACVPADSGSDDEWPEIQLCGQVTVGGTLHNWSVKELASSPPGNAVPPDAWDWRSEHGSENQEVPTWRIERHASMHDGAEVSLSERSDRDGKRAGDEWGDADDADDADRPGDARTGDERALGNARVEALAGGEPKGRAAARAAGRDAGRKAAERSERTPYQWQARERKPYQWSAPRTPARPREPPAPRRRSPWAGETPEQHELRALSTELAALEAELAEEDDEAWPPAIEDGPKYSYAGSDSCHRSPGSNFRSTTPGVTSQGMTTPSEASELSLRNGLAMSAPPRSLPGQSYAPGPRSPERSAPTEARVLESPGTIRRAHGAAPQSTRTPQEAEEYEQLLKF